MSNSRAIKIKRIVPTEGAEFIRSQDTELFFNRTGDSAKTITDIEKTSKAVGRKPNVFLVAVLTNTFEYYKSQNV